MKKDFSFKVFFMASVQVQRNTGGIGGNQQEVQKFVPFYKMAGKYEGLCNKTGFNFV